MSTFRVVPLLLLVLILSACGGSNNAAPEPTPQPVAVERGTIVTTVSSSGHLQPLRSARLSMAGGDVAELLVAVGDEVTADQPLLTLNSGSLERNVALAEEALRLQESTLAALEAGASNLERSAAQAAVDRAQINLDNLEFNLTEEQADNNSQVLAARAQLAQAKVALQNLTPSESQLNGARSQVEQARLQLENAQAALAAATLRAPFNGRIMATFVEVGEQAAGPMIEIADDSQFELVLNVDEVDMAAVAVGQPATVRVDAFANKPLAAEVVRISPAANSSPTSPLVSYDVVLRLSESELALRSGMSATADITTAEKSNTLLLPNRAIQINRDAGNATVLRWAEGTTQEVTVETGLRNSTQTEILSGIEEGVEVMPSDYTPAEETEPSGFFRGPPGRD